MSEWISESMNEWGSHSFNIFLAISWDKAGSCRQGGPQGKHHVATHTHGHYLPRNGWRWPKMGSRNSIHLASWFPLVAFSLISLRASSQPPGIILLKFSQTTPEACIPESLHSSLPTHQWFTLENLIDTRESQQATHKHFQLPPFSGHLIMWLALDKDGHHL